MFDFSIQSVLENFQKPSSYLGNETNAIIKDPEKVKLRFGLVFPDLYEIGTSHFGIQILYHILNRHPEIYAERVYAPSADLMGYLEKSGRQLTSLETKTPLREFDIIGFSLLYELNYTNILHILRLSKIAYESRDRKRDLPFIIAGGPCTSNPEPLAPFFDAFVIGDGEKVVLEIAETFLKWKARNGKHKKELLEQWAFIEGIYVPSFYKVEYVNGRQVIQPESGFPKKIKRAVISHLDKNNFPDAPIVPYGRPVHDRLRLEVSRGCTRGCRFCQAGIIYRPVRERHPEQLLELALKALAKTGYEDVSLLSLSTGDYGCLLELIQALIRLGKNRNLAVSLPSIRAGALSAELMELIRKVRKTGFTIAPEAGSQRLRDVINKNVDYHTVQETVAQAFKLGWQVIKLYFMVGLPTETDDDIRKLIEMVRKIKKSASGKGRGGKINVSVATFIPKPHTPFQWHGQISLASSLDKISLIRRELRTSKVQVKWQNPEMSLLEGLWARGDRRLSKLLVMAVKRGCAFDGWSDSFQFNKWRDCLKASEIDLDFFVHRKRSLDEVLPWEHIDIGISQQFLKNEWHKALKGEKTPDCRWNGCLDCGTCDFDEIKPVLHTKAENIAKTEISIGSAEKGKQPQRWILFRFKKVGAIRLLGHLEMAQVFIRAFRRAEVELVYRGGFHPMPKIAFMDALPLGMESQDEVGYAMVESEKDNFQIKIEVNRQLPEGLELMDCKTIESPKKIETKGFRYRINYDGKMLAQDALKIFQEAEIWPFKKLTKKGQEKVTDLKASIIDITSESNSTIVMTISNKQDKRVRPVDALKSIFGLSRVERGKVRVVKIATLID